MIVKAVQDVPATPVTEAEPGRNHSVALQQSRRRATFAMRYFVVSPGGSTPRHAHPWEHEVFVLQGQCTAFCEGETRTVGSNHAIYIEPGAIHSFSNDGTEDLVFLCMIPLQQ